jgi:predicted nucleic acid-binding protein
VQRGGIALDGAAPDSLTELLRISERFASLPFDLADASIAEAASRLRLRPVLTLDADFDVHRDKRGEPLVKLLR